MIQVRKIRRELGIAQVELAGEAGVSNANLSIYEGGYRRHGGFENKVFAALIRIAKRRLHAAERFLGSLDGKGSRPRTPLRSRR